MKLVPLNETQADGLTRNRNISWDGWDLLIWSPNPHGFTNPRGAYRNGRWGMLNRIPVNAEGNWMVPVKYVRSS